jgi:hypothetical protein
MRATLARRGALLLAALVLVTVISLALASSAQAVGTLKAGAHGRANVVDLASNARLAPDTGSGVSGAGLMAAGLAALALVLGGIGMAGRAGWSAGRRDAALSRPSAAVSPSPGDLNGEEESEARRKAA